MKTQYKSTVLSAIVFFVFVIAAFFFTFYSSLFIEKWLNFINNLLVGVISSAILLFLTSLISYKILQKSNARHLGILISKFKNDFLDFYRILFPYKDGNAFIGIPQNRIFAIEALLNSMRDTLSEILSSEKITPFAFKIIKKFNSFVSKLTKDEFNFFQFCSQLLDKLNPAYIDMHDTVYINHTTETRYTIEFTKNLEDFVFLMSAKSDGYKYMENYCSDIDQFLKIEKNKKD
jgi:hypothetical protein